MTIQDYFNYKARKDVEENISMVCLRQRHRDINKKMNKFLEGLR